MAVVVSSLPVVHANSSKTVTFTDTKRREIVRQANMKAARAVADIIRTTLEKYREIKSILKEQALKSQFVIDILCDIYPDFHDALYKILSRLHEDDQQHARATDSHINILPISTIKRVENDCVICLETPAAGDAMRHLPCLHNFHKEYIDTWLRRRNACPLCKSAITSTLQIDHVSAITYKM